MSIIASCAIRELNPKRNILCAVSKATEAEFPKPNTSILSAERNESQQACKACLSTACFVFSSEQYIFSQF